MAVCSDKPVFGIRINWIGRWQYDVILWKLFLIFSHIFIHCYQNVTQELFNSSDLRLIIVKWSLPSCFYWRAKKQQAATFRSVGGHIWQRSIEPRISSPSACSNIASLSSGPQQPLSHSHILSLFSSAFLFSSITVFLSFFLSSSIVVTAMLLSRGSLFVSLLMDPSFFKWRSLTEISFF